MNSGQLPSEPRLATDCIPFLAKTVLLSELPASEVESLAGHMEVRAFSRGDL